MLSFIQMSDRAEILFTKLQSTKAISALVGKSEDGDFDCKEWRSGPGMNGSIAKAACGFANATGGVLVVGMKATGTGSGTPDVIQSESPVADVGAVSSAILDIILKLVEPGIEGIRVHLVRKPARAKSGFVLVYIPESEGSPHRSKVDSKFYVRIASGTVPMEYFQIEDRFGRRPRAKLTVSLSGFSILGAPLGMGQFVRHIGLVVTNEGRGLARFPALRIGHVSSAFIPNNVYYPAPAWPASDGVPGWTSLRGGTDNVLYPGESLRVAVLIQSEKSGDRGTFEALNLKTEVICDGMQVRRQAFAIETAIRPQ
jgi:hypothetical protein